MGAWVWVSAEGGGSSGLDHSRRVVGEEDGFREKRGPSARASD